MTTLLAPYAATLLSLIVLDSLWIGLIMANFYKNTLSQFVGEGFSLIPAGILYFVFAAGVTYFAVSPANSLMDAVLKGLFLGFVVYAVYDLTNLAAFKTWPLQLALIDILWGSAMVAASSAAGYWVLTLLK